MKHLLLLLLLMSCNKSKTTGEVVDQADCDDNKKLEKVLEEKKEEAFSLQGEDSEGCTVDSH